MMNSLSILGHIAKDLVSKAYEFDSKKHKLKPGEILVVSGRGKPKLVMNKKEHEDYIINRHKREFNNLAARRGHRNISIDPNVNPQMEDMIRHEIRHGIKNRQSGSWSNYGVKQNLAAAKTMHGKTVPHHDTKATSKRRNTPLTLQNLKALDEHNKKVNFKPKKNSLADVKNRHGYLVRDVHYGNKPKTDNAYKIHYTQNMVDHETNQHIDKLNTQILQAIADNRLHEIKPLHNEILRFRAKAVKHQKYVNKLPNSNGHKLIVKPSIAGTATSNLKEIKSFYGHKG